MDYNFLIFDIHRPQLNEVSIIITWGKRFLRVRCSNTQFLSGLQIKHIYKETKLSKLKCTCEIDIPPHDQAYRVVNYVGCISVLL